MSTPLTADSAKSQQTTPYDYIIVGSGAGGGPLACRLAQAGKRVLLLESGGDPARAKSVDYPDAAPGEVHDVPGYHAAATEDQEMSWQFSVRHYENKVRQEGDSKYAPSSLHLDPLPPDATSKTSRTERSIERDADGTGGIFYPRSSGIGGCTGHHAMIVIRPNDRDWDHIADLTGDASWRAVAMRPYFAKFERCLYADQYRGWLGNLLGIFTRAWRWLARLINPEAAENRGGHGDRGWQPTSFLSPDLIKRIVGKDKALKLILLATFIIGLKTNRLLALVKRFLVQFGNVQQLDPNDTRTRTDNPEGVFLIPTGFETGDAKDEGGRALRGRRAGVRELIYKTMAEFPDRLVVEQGVHVLRVIFAPGDKAPRAVGVECQRGEHLYKASPLPGKPVEKPFPRFTKGEVILCGGAFNTPQMLMLSGIGDTAPTTGAVPLPDLRDKKGSKVSSPIHLPGVGKNLQDRYEVGVISEMKEDFSTLAEEGLSFTPGDSSDGGRKEWLKDKSGLYAGNGGTLAIVRRSSHADGPEPDLFTFGVPAAFRGYHWRWSKELLHSKMRPYCAKGADERKPQRNLWTWVILKAYTRNNGGTVRLRSDSPFDTPAICFHSFDGLNGASPAGWDRDVKALLEAVAEMRQINRKATELNPGLFVNEVQPGPNRPDSDDIHSPLATWIKNEAWGHHACGTCRIGRDSWKANTGELLDKGAVLDSSFRVHGVRGLRVVDASVFPKIPGYFILAPIFMVSEKAADTILKEADTEAYPPEFEEAEAAAVVARRIRAPLPNVPVGVKKLPEDTVGLALSGGGIRSATFALGLLQALAEKRRLRKVDFLSTVSGGGFTGSFLGRLFTRKEVQEASEPCKQVEDRLRDTRSPSLWWLRTQANYLFASGFDDVKQHLAVFFRNVFTVHLVIGALLFGIFGLLASVPHVLERLGRLRSYGGEGNGILRWFSNLPEGLTSLFEKLASALKGAPDVPGLSHVQFSIWWWLPVAALGLGVLPATLGYWLAPKTGARRVHPFFPLLAWIVLVVGGTLALPLLPSRWALAAGAAIVTLALAWLWQEAARWGLPRDVEDAPQKHGVIVRNRLTRSLGEVQVIFIALLLWVALDTLAMLAARQENFIMGMTAVMAALAPVLPWFNRVAAFISTLKPAEKAGGFSLAGFARKVGPMLALGLLFAVDVLAHAAFAQGVSWAGLLAVAVALAFSAAVGRAFDFLNLSTLAASYGARITRTFQGASNEARIHPTASTAKDVQVAHPGDDVAYHRYHPEQQGGPLHLINVCINETVEQASQRQVRDRKSLPMSVGPAGVTVGRRYFAKWAVLDGLPKWLKRRRRREGLDLTEAENQPVGLRRVPLPSDPEEWHPLASRHSSIAAVESLTLGEWIALSGAAFTTGLGRGTSLPMALFMGLVNFRLGRWWSSGILSEERPGQYQLSLWRRIKRLPVSFFRMQSLLLSEWRARYEGPNRWHWYLSDGGHFEVTGAYELIRRRLPFIIVSDAGEDGSYQFEDLAVLTRSVREDFGAEIEWVGSTAPRTASTETCKCHREPEPKPLVSDPASDSDPWAHFPSDVPSWIKEWIEPSACGNLADLRRQSPHHAALARVKYSDGSTGWLLLLKPSLSGDESQDIAQYSVANVAFPQQPTFDQAFDDAQWESYRALGRHIGLTVLRDPSSI